EERIVFGLNTIAELVPSGGRQVLAAGREDLPLLRVHVPAKQLDVLARGLLDSVAPNDAPPSQRVLQTLAERRAARREVLVLAVQLHASRPEVGGTLGELLEGEILERMVHSIGKARHVEEDVAQQVEVGIVASAESDHLCLQHCEQLVE